MSSERAEMEKKRRSREEERRYIADLTGFDNLKAFLEAKALIKRKSRKRKRKRKSKKNYNRIDASTSREKDQVHSSVEKAKVLVMSDQVNFAGVIDLSSSSESDEVISVPAEMFMTREMKTKEGQKENIDAPREKEQADTSLKITNVLAARDGINSTVVIDLCSSESDGVISVPAKSIEMKEMKPTRRNENVDIAKEVKQIDTSESMETESIEMEDNIVLRQLLRKPRYFDPPNDSWVTCSCCGKEGHMAVQCRTLKRKKPCFVCGSSEHIWKRCRQRKSNLRLEKDKENKSNPDICLRCGDSGHDMFSCRSDNLPDDLKEIQCYVCRNFGHLCCSSFPDLGPRELSCYNCGQSGHLGSDCINLCGATSGSKASIVCYKCGEQGHFANRCTNPVKGDEQGTDDLLTPPSENYNGMGIFVRSDDSTPHDLYRT